MGNLHIALSSALKILGADVIVPPYNSKKTLSLGTRNSPEAICLPYKLLIGNYIEAIEAGAEGILMIDSPGICRLGQYGSGARETLSDLGYDVEFVNFNLYNGKLMEMYNKFKFATGNSNPLELIRAINIALTKVEVLDKLDSALNYYRAREIHIGSADAKYKKALNVVQKAMTSKECKKSLDFGLAQLASVPIDKNKEVLQVDLTGEFYVVLEPFSNMEIEKELGRLGVHVHRKVNVSDWTKAFLIPSFLRFSKTHEEIARIYAKGFLNRDIGGDAIESIGDSVYAGNQDKDGVVHLLPFTCLPEIMTQNILPNIRSENDIPVLSLILDEQMGRAGFVTRLEAFVDLIRRRRRQKQNKPIILTKAINS
jgi:predicted nucleotide-binding protein (sugar kinase/HSP70/actin superfamily)